jgi:predicted acylesterase/phospholipase RssA
MKNQFEEEVFPTELEEIANRRKRRELQAPDQEGRPSVQKDLIGLALSGGGIRSSTFSLGVIQALAKSDIFRYIDYLSTVSGGGYIGSCLSSILNSPGVNESVFSAPGGDEDTPLVKQLRNGSNYLGGDSSIDKMRLLMIVIRGILLNLWLIIPPLILAVFFTEFLTELWHLAGEPKFSPVFFLAPFLVLALLYPTVLRIMGNRFNWRMRNFYERALAIVLSLSILLLFLVPILWLVRFSIDNSWKKSLISIFPEGSLYHSGILLGGSAAIFILIRAFKVFPGAVRSIIKLSVAIVGPLVIFGIYLIFCIFFVQSPYFENKIDQKDIKDHRTFNEILDDLAKKNGEELNEKDAASFGILSREMSENEFIIPQLSPNDPNPVSIEQTGETKTWDITIGNESIARIQWERGGDYLFVPEMSLFAMSANWTFYGIGAIMILLNLLFFDANVISTHSFYRDRLSGAFLFKSEDDTSIEPNDDQRLSGLNGDGSLAPYHLINTALNLPACNDVNLRGRNTDFFTLSKHFCGGEHTTYCKTSEIEEIDRHLNLGSAMAISAAAAAPNMGTSTNKSFVFIMTALNLRLGYWIPNPLKITPAGRVKRFLWPNVGPGYLLKESLGKLDAKSSHVNLSDGGHIENLAIYQLLRRRCKLIIAVDAEADPDAAFNGLVTLIRFARIDLGIEIKLNLKDFQKDELGVSKTHWMLATIHYGPNAVGDLESGHLLYLKSSLTGDENEYIKAYRDADPTFPHQTTADQFFDETQFEVYRSLGEHIAINALEDSSVKAVLPFDAKT